MIRRTTEDIVVDIINYTLLVIIIFITLYPFYYVLILSFNEGIDAMRGGIYFFPRSFSMENYKKLFTDPIWINAISVSAARTVLGTVLASFFIGLVSYALAHRDLHLKNFYFAVFIFSMYFSGGLIPYYILLKSLKLTNTFWVYVIPGLLNVFYMLIMISFFREIPESLEESAKLDGANELYIFVKIIFPLSKPAFAVIALFLAVGHWNAWMDAAYFVQKRELKTLAYQMMVIINQSAASDAMKHGGSQEAVQALAGKTATVTTRSLQMASMIVAVVPILGVYPFLQKYFIKGILLGAVKE